VLNDIGVNRRSRNLALSLRRYFERNRYFSTLAGWQSVLGGVLYNHVSNH